ncbi:ubiquitin-conjugating enzyme E2 Z-like [Lingula anatina]|uniref:Ubiquitin-conjugating enzyme E2 Z n=1 Tax=Lingula anatina TaxID=7574 RepID=A0A1S3H2B3_LINAN|nr:ubiquitin-conjugating enzyme E2 Z-like [Lingula anatina]|eukprot:XP_013379616.2 ubiquitin-conjugating enzyme E2 Z-like [Lingula anatina]
MATADEAEILPLAESFLAADVGESSSPTATMWDPLSCKDWDNEKASPQCLTRIKRDIMSIYQEPPPGMCIVPDKDNITKIHALITGPFDTPYEGGFFYFLIRCPPDYPIRAPRVRLLTTGDGRVRFNPNLYRNGKVCLSILGTWSGPAWSPAQSLSSVLISIQSLMNEKPYHNEPGFEQERTPGDAKRYNDIIRHETLRVAVCDMLEGRCQCPQALREVMEKSFPEYYDYYESTCLSNSHLSGQNMQDPFGEKRGKFDYGAILKRLQTLKVKLEDRFLSSDCEDLSDDSGGVGGGGGGGTKGEGDTEDTSNTNSQTPETTKHNKGLRV